MTPLPPEGPGAIFKRWKLQRVVARQQQQEQQQQEEQQRRPEPPDHLPKPPEGCRWQQHAETKEWRLVTENGEELFLHEEAPKTLMMIQGGPLIVDQTDETDGEESKVNEGAGDDWSLLSDRISAGSFGGLAIMVPKTTTSASSTAGGGGGGAGGSTNFSITSLDSTAYRLQRTLSSSTIDSTEGTLSSQVTGVLGVDYVEHVVLPTDTFQGICLAYKISATRLRQVNHFSGSNLSSAPKKLIIPLTKKALRSGFIRVQDKETREYKLHAFLVEVPSLKEREAKTYLELADWVLEDAIHAAWEDGERHKEEDDTATTKTPNKKKNGGDICIKVNLKNGVPIGFRAQGAGDTVPYGKFDNNTNSSSSSSNGNNSPFDNSDRMESVTSGVVDMTIYEGVPTSVSKNVSPQDIYEAAPQHNGFGLELQPLAKKSDT